jgi:hypothetical protein
MTIRSHRVANSILAALGALAAAVCIVAPLYFGSHDWRVAYLPNVVVAVGQLTVGAALVGVYARTRKRNDLAPLQILVDQRIESDVIRLLEVIHSSFVEASPRHLPSVPLPVPELLERWRDAIPRLDLRRPCTLEPETPWSIYLTREVVTALEGLATTIGRFPRLLEKLVKPVVALEDDEFVSLLRHLRAFDANTTGQPPATLPGYYHWTPWTGPVLLENFTDRVQALVDAMRRRNDRPLLDEILWIDSIPPLWGSGMFDPQADAREARERAGIPPSTSAALIPVLCGAGAVALAAGVFRSGRSNRLFSTRR